MKAQQIKIQPKDDFFRVLTHELKSPLTPIQTYLPLLVSEKLGELNKEQRDALRIISKNIDRLSHLILDVLTMARLESKEIKFNFGAVSIDKVMESAVKSLRWQAKEKNIQINTYFSNLPPIEGDGERLSQVFHNLIENAIKFTSKKGRIDISAEKKGYSFIISVKDNGIGISPSKLKKIFDKFYQVDNSLTRKYRGSGLGLTICQGIVKAHGGEIKVKSKPKKGTSFQVVLPYKRLGKPTEAFGEIISGGGGGR